MIPWQKVKADLTKKYNGWDCIIKKAAEDIKKSRDWYDEKEENLGRLFVEKVHECLIRIADNPKAHPH